jgi:Flp pilus assembly protein TadD
MKWRAGWPVLALAVAVVGCAPEDQRTDTIDLQAAEEARADLDPETVAQLDSGNVAFRARDMDRAVRHYRRVTELAPDLAAGWFGVYMTETMRGNTEAADSAFQQAQKLAPGASLLRPNENGSGP